MNNSLRGRDYINIHDLSSEDFRYLIDLAWNLRLRRSLVSTSATSPAKTSSPTLSGARPVLVAHSRPPATIWAWASLI